MKNQKWLDTSISFPNYTISSKKVSRPQMTFGASSERTKRQKTESLRKNFLLEELSFATHMSLRSAGQVEASNVVKEVTQTTPTRATKYRTAFKNYSAPKKRQLTGAEALAMCVEAQLTRHQYNIIREQDKDRFPSYKKIQAAKKECYPQKESIIVTDTAAEVKLQALLDHTASRLLDAQYEVLSSKKPESFQKLILICKWSFDGSGQAEYKQTFDSDPSASNANIFISSLVPDIGQNLKATRNYFLAERKKFL